PVFVGEILVETLPRLSFGVVHPQLAQAGLIVQHRGGDLLSIGRELDVAEVGEPRHARQLPAGAIDPHELRQPPLRRLLRGQQRDRERRDRASSRHQITRSPHEHMVGFHRMSLKRVSAPTIVLAFLCFMYLITYVARQNLATASGAIGKDLGLSNSQIGQVIGTFGITYAIFQILGGWIGDKWGARRTLFVCGLIWASATVLTGLAGSLVTLYMVRLLLGVGEGATFPVATRAMQSWTPPERRGFA